MTPTTQLLCYSILTISCFQIALSTDHILSPTNTAVPKGNRTELRCRPKSTSDVYSWVFQPAGTTEDAVIYSSGVGANNNKTASFYVRKLSDGSVDLIFKSTELSDAGLYTCMIRVNVTEEGAVAIIQKTAQLIVLDGEPQCSTNITKAVSDEDVIEMRCSIGFRGNWAPVMTWRLDAEDGARVSDGVEVITQANASVTSTLKLSKRLVMTSARLIICRTHFISHIGGEESVANKIPDYNYTWFFQCHNAVDKKDVTTHWPLAAIIVTVLCGTGLIISAFITTVVIIVHKSRRETQTIRTCKPSTNRANVPPSELYEDISKMTGASKCAPNQNTTVLGMAHEQESTDEDVQSWMTTHRHLYSYLIATDEAERDVVNTIQENAITPNQSSPVYEEIMA